MAFEFLNCYPKQRYEKSMTWFKRILVEWLNTILDIETGRIDPHFKSLYFCVPSHLC